MPEVTVEPGEVKRGACDECGGQTGLAIGFAYQDGGAKSIYNLDWCEGDHPARMAYLTVASGDWSDESTAADRMAVGIEIRAEGMTLADSPMRDRPDFFGRFVPREELLALGGVDGLWHLVDHLVTDDRANASVVSWVLGERDTGFVA